MYKLQLHDLLLIFVFLSVTFHFLSLCLKYLLLFVYYSSICLFLYRIGYYLLNNFYQNTELYSNLHLFKSIYVKPLWTWIQSLLIRFGFKKNLVDKSTSTRLLGGGKVAGHQAATHTSTTTSTTARGTLMYDSHCIICMDNLKTVLLIPCRHLCLCSTCAINSYSYQHKCPICRVSIKQKINVFM